MCDKKVQELEDFCESDEVDSHDDTDEFVELDLFAEGMIWWIWKGMIWMFGLLSWAARTDDSP